MAGQADRSGTGQTGPTAPRPSAGRPRAKARRPAQVPFPVEIGVSPEPLEIESSIAASPAPIPPDVRPRLVQTQAAYRRLITSGFSSKYAADLIGYVVGLPGCESRWSLTQVNKLLFLRSLYSESDWGRAERRPE
jgi:hypothetical protein